MPHNESRSRVPSANGASSRGPHSSTGTRHCRAIIAAAPFGAEVAVRDEQGVNPLILEMSGPPAPRALVADHAVGQHTVEIDVAHAPAFKSLLD